MLRDPLAEPYTLGVSSGAAVGAVLAICFGFQSTGFASLIGAALVLLIVVSMSIDGRRMSSFTLLLTDIVMPEQEGIETIVELRRMSYRLPIIAVSGGGREAGSETDTYLEWALSLGAQRVFPKPLDRARVLAAVAELTSGPA